MRIRHLRIRINTNQGLHGTDISFPDGLVVLWADNSMGKSTCIKSILIALGFEAMLTANQRDLPLPPVMKSELDSESGIATVIESDIFLEVENASGDRIVVHRTVKGTRSKDLITVTHGPAISQPTRPYRSDDFFVSRPGAASREHGFHRFLTDFLSWDLPEVQTFDGRQYPLYLQCVFPYFIVEQTRGWSGIDPPIPTQFRIREVHKRSVEFILNLDAYRLAARRLELDREAADIESRWSVAIGEIRATAHSIGGVANGLPSKPVSTWPPQILPSIVLPQDENWLPAEDEVAAKKAALKALIDQEIPRVGEVVESSQLELHDAQRALAERESVLARLLASLDMERGESYALTDRLNKIEEDLQRNKDVRTLFSLGSTTVTSIAEHVCPTCHQKITDSLAPLAEGQSAMSIDENISFLEGQRATFRAVLKNVDAVVEARERQVDQLRELIASHRARIRVLRQTLVSDARLPSRAAIQKQLELQQQISRSEAAIEEFSSGLFQLEELSLSWAKVQKERVEMPAEDASADDRKKIARWSLLFSQQLHQYDFQSLSPSTIIISPDTYRPTSEGFDLPTNISASDLIRVIWAHLAGLLELSRDFATNHPGLLIFDEPKQQSAKDLSFSQLLRRASESANFGQQVIFATSESRERIREMVSDILTTYIEFDGRIIRPLSV